MDKVFYIRHNWKENLFDSISNELFKENKIGVHFEKVNDFKNPDAYNYKSARTSINYMNECNDNDNILVVASYKFQDVIFIGKPEKGSFRVEDINKKQIKTIKLKDIKKIKINDFSLPFLVAPPFATMVHWKMGEKAVNSFYYKSKNKPITVTLDMLLPWQMELLCEEYLREQKILNSKLYQTGKYMKDFDIVGTGKDSKIVIAQVKYKSTPEVITEFFKQCESIKNSEPYFFTSCDNDKLHKNQVHFSPLEVVFHYFNCNKNKEKREYINRLFWGG